MCKKLLNLSRLSIIIPLIVLSLLPLACSPGEFGYSLTVTVNPASSGNVSANPFPSGLYLPGSLVQLTATPDPDWTFTGWSGDLNGSANPVTITMNGPKTVTATFTSSTTPLTYDFTITDPTADVSLTTLDFSGSAISGGTFTITKYVKITNIGTGTISSVTASLNPSSAVGILAPLNQWTLSGTTDLSNGIGSLAIRLTGPVTFLTTTLPTFIIDVKANVPLQHTLTGTATITVTPATTTRPPQYTLTTSIRPTGTGSIGLSKSVPYYYGDVVQLTANPATDWTFSGWSGDATGNTNPLNITMSGNKSITANFVQNQYILTVAANPVSSGTVTKSPDQATYISGAQVQVTATQSSDWRFSGWSGDATGNANPLNVTMNSNKTVSANFVRQFTLSTSVRPAGSGTIYLNPPGGIYDSGMGVSLTATAATGWTFSGWSGSTDLASTAANPTTITMKSNETVTATFILTSPNVKIQSVTLPSSVIANSGISYPTTFRLVNNESVNVTVTWKANSSVTGNFDNGSVTVPANGYVNVPKSYVYTTAGPVSLSYSIFYNGDPINSWSGTLNVKAVPNVKIQSVTLPSGAKTSSGIVVTTYPTTFRLVNNESVDVTVNWQGNSSITGNFDSGSVTVPANSYVDVTKNYYYITTGTETITYTIYYNGAQIDSWSGIHIITAFVPNVKIQSVTLPSGAKTSSGIVVTTYPTTFRLVNSESFDITVNWQAHSSVTGNFGNGSVTVPKNGYVDVTNNYYYTVAGVVNLTYTIYYNSNQIDTWSGTMNVLPGY